MDFNAVLVLGALWFLVNLLTGLKRKGRPPAPPQARRPAGPAPLSPPDPTQREGSRLQQVLREFERALEQAESAGRDVRLPRPAPEEVEERQSLESEPKVVSLELNARQAARRAYTQDSHAEEIVARRIQAASDRDSAQTKVDHVKFDSQIRQEPADHTATRGYTAEELRRGVVWREVLGPPVSLRNESGV